MVCTEYVEWVKNKFYPDPVILPDAIIMQNLEEAIDYWNNHSAFKVTETVDIEFSAINNGCQGQRAGKVQLSTRFKFVTRVFPQKVEAQGLNYTPESMILGLTATNRFMSEDYIQWKHWLKGWQTYANSNFRAKFMESEDPLNVGGMLYVQSVPFYSTKATVEGGLRIFSNQDVKDPQIFNWIRNYTYALCAEQQGRGMRKASMIGVASDGDSQVNEATVLKGKLEEELKKSGSWMILLKRG